VIKGPGGNSNIEESKYSMVITKILIEPLNKGDLRAYVSIVFDDCFAIHGLKIVHTPDGLRVAMPSHRMEDGGCVDIAFPINSETRKWLEARIITAYAELLVTEAPETRKIQ
jgi:stage V sporulation protein G